MTEAHAQLSVVGNCSSEGETAEPVVIVAIWRINSDVVHGQSAVSG